MTLQDKVAVVTGASRGIGEAVAVELARQGAHVVVAARTLEEPGALPGTLAQTVAAVQALGRDALGVRCNVAKEEDLLELVRQTVDRFGHIDVLVNNAAFTGTAAAKGTRDTTRKEWELQFAINVHAPFTLTQAFLPHFPANGGVVINVTSSSAVHRPVAPGGGGSWSPAYGATKAAMNRLGNFWASELLASRIAVITVDPGLVFSATMEALSPTGEIAPWQVTTAVPAKAIAFLAALEEPMQHTGDLIDGPELVRRIGL